MQRCRILIADDHNLVAELCKSLLEPEFEVLGIVGDGRSLLRVASALKPDVIVVDIAMPVLNGLDAARQIKTMLPSTKLLFLTMTRDAEVAAEAFHRGASGYLVKTCAASEMVTAVRELLQGKTYLSRTLPKDDIVFLRLQHKRLVEEGERLTKRQREVLRLLAEGRRMRDVGDILHVTTRTVTFHKQRIKKMLGANSDAELVKFALRTHLIAS